MKKNFKIGSWLLFSSSIVLVLVSNFLIQDVQTKALLLVLSFVMGGAGFIQVILFLMKPDLFKDKPKREDYDQR